MGRGGEELDGKMMAEEAKAGPASPSVCWQG